jgi:hypothetical protein
VIETEEQRRWWFATHPQFSSSRKGTRASRQKEEKDATGKVRPEDVDEALKYERGPVAELLIPTRVHTRNVIWVRPSFNWG